MKIRAFILLCVSALATSCGSQPTGTRSTPTAPAASSGNNQQPNGCRTIVTEGSYTLDQDIGTPDQPGAMCLTISANNVAVDCAHHSIHGDMWIEGAALVSVTNCTMTAATLTRVSNVTISNSILAGMLAVASGRSVVLDHNQITLAGGKPAAVVYLQNGQDNRVTGSVLDGDYHGNDLTGHGSDGPGADDGVLLVNETGDLVDGNTIQNVYDAGIEGADVVNAATISNNTITHAISAGISSYWCTDWETNTISGNAVSNSIAALWIIHLSGAACDDGDLPKPPDQFTGNAIVGNTLRDPLGAQVIGIEIGMDGTVNSNAVKGNDVGGKQIELTPLEGFSNGGGNTCGSGGSFEC